MVVDKESVKNLVDGSVELLEQLLKVSQRDWPEQMNLLKEGITAKDFAAMQKILHRLNGNIRNFHAKPLVQKISLYEEEVESSKEADWTQRWEEIQRDLKVVSQEISELISEMKESKS